MLAGLIASLCLAAIFAFAKLPESETLSAQDRAVVDAAIDRLERLLPSASDKNTISYEIARTWAAAKQWPKAVDWLRKVAAANVGFDPSRDSIFAALRGSSEFDAILSVSF